MKRSALKRDARDELMRGMQAAIAGIQDVNTNSYFMDKRNEMIEQFRRVEKDFGYKPGHWRAFPSR